MCGLQPKGRQDDKDLMFCLNVVIDQLVMANSVHCYGHVLCTGILMS